ncbi:MAG: ABC transporter permease [Bacteroidales bacterium]|nr:ABC transporter permease [Bacteroidales bacterium]
MLKNFFQVTFRNILRDKVYLILNVLGLTLGIAGSILITLYVRHELSYDGFHEKSDRIYRINSYSKLEGREMSAAVSAPPQARTFMEEYPEIEDATRYYHPADQKVSVEAVTYHEKNFFYADSNFLELFNFPLEKGDPGSALRKPYSVIITSEIADKLFGTQDVIGKSIVLNNDKIYQVTGLINEVPRNTHFRFDYLASFVSLDLSRSEFWLSQMLETFIILPEGYAYKELETKYGSLMDKYVLPQLEQLIPIKVNNYKEFEAAGNVFKFLLQPLKELRFNKQFLFGYDKSTDKVYIYFFSLVAIFLLFIACVNFMNLATARYSYRTKEVGIKKVLGSDKSQLIRQFLSESMLITLISMIIALTLVELILPGFNNFTEADLQVGYFSKWYIIPALAGLTLFIGLLSGLYPAFYLSSFNPVEILKSKFNKGPGNIKLRSVLVIIQFSITIILLISTFVVSSQLRYIRNKDLGYNKENLLVVKNTGDLGEQSETFREQLLKIPGVMNASRSWTFPGDMYYATSYQLQGDSLNRLLNFEIIQGDYDFIPTLNMKIVRGRNFSRDYSTDNMSVIINESAVQYLGLKEPVGARLTTPNREGGQDILEIIGVIKDVCYKSLHERIQPTVIGFNADKMNAYTIIRIEGESLLQTIKQVEKVWNDFLPHQSIEFTFVDKNLNNLYKSEMQAGTVFTLFAILAIFIACLGLLGLSAFAAEKRTREIGIRKAHGASIASILRLLSREIIILISLSSVIAWPVVYYLMNKWLQNFAYQTTMKFWVFLVSSCIGLVIAIAVVVYQSLKAARINPVEALKCE